MRIGLVTPGFSADHADWCIPALRHLARQLATQDDVRIITVRYPYAAARYAIDGADVLALGGARSRGAATLRLWRHALDTLRAEQHRRPFDVLHAFWATESGLLTALAGRLLRIPTLVSVAGGELVALRDVGYGDQRLAWERLKVAASLRLASAVSAGSCQLLGVLHRRAPDTSSHYLPLGVDTHLFQPSPSHPAETHNHLLHVGALTPIKDQALLLHAFARLRRRMPNTTLEIVGDGPLQASLTQLARQLQIEDAVCFRGAADHAGLPAAYARAATFVLTSRHEAQGMVALEAAACGRGVVGTRVGVVPELEAAGAAGSAATGNADALADALQSVLDDPELARRRGEAARELVEREFSLERCTERFRNVYAGLVHTR
jgi:glycosyltransferase involved in cell wall biosynthesis